jgi:hypothetical protein
MMMDLLKSIGVARLPNLGGSIVGALLGIFLIHGPPENGQDRPRKKPLWAF